MIPRLVDNLQPHTLLMKSEVQVKGLLDASTTVSLVMHRKVEPNQIH
uniref:Uncharacterized protein n=1 Tax=Solanum lycopersicum TaxID=4081 RepID=A0A3Q7G9Y1_SOLLC